MVDFYWNHDIINDLVDLTDCIELVAAFSYNAYGGRFTRANFIDALQDDLLNGNRCFQGEEVDRFNSKFEEAMSLIEKRKLWLGEIYPFRHENHEVRFEPQISDKNYLSYLFLLLCSCHTKISRLSIDFPVQFENFCKEVMRVIFPSADVFLFSKNSKDRQKLGSTADKAIPALAKKLNTQISRGADLPATQKEYGIDLIAIYSFDDELEYPFFAFAQCTLRKEWWNKRHEAQSRQALVGVIQLAVDHSNFLMIPYFPRVKAIEWSQPRDRTVNCLLCDRYRICRLLEKSTTFTYQNLPLHMHDIFQEIENYLPDNR